MGKVCLTKNLSHRIRDLSKSAMQKRLEETLEPIEKELSSIECRLGAKAQIIAEIKESLGLAKYAVDMKDNKLAQDYLDKSLDGIHRQITAGEYWAKSAQEDLKKGKQALAKGNTQLELILLNKSLESLRQAVDIDKFWVDSAWENLRSVKQALEDGEIQKGWNLFHDTSSIITQLQSVAEGRFRNQAQQILSESQKKLDGWRKDIVTKYLCDDNGKLKKVESLKANDVYEASKILNQRHNNMYLKLNRAKEQLVTLAFAVLILVPVSVVILSLFFGQDWVLLTSAVLFGAIGAASSGIISVDSRSTQVGIPEQLLSSWSVLIKPIYGAVTGLAISMFLQSGIVQLGVLSNFLIWAFSFIAGFSERLFLGLVEKSGGGK
jgi:hypothetical protein